MHVCLWTCTGRSDELAASSELYQAISELPQPNRDTLAYLITHLHRYSTFHLAITLHMAVQKHLPTCQYMAVQKHLPTCQ